jgi:hypothetical protein
MTVGVIIVLKVLLLLLASLGFLALLVAMHAVDALGCLCKDEVVNLAIALDAPEAVCMVSIVAYIGHTYTHTNTPQEGICVS